MPFTDSPSHRAEIPTASERAIAAVVADSGSHDSRAHTSPVIRVACPSCDALSRERCVADRYPSGRPRVFARDFCPTRYAAAGVTP